MDKGKKIFLWIAATCIGLAAVGSFFHLTTTFAIYGASEDRLRHAVLEREHVSTWLESLERSIMMREYNIEHGIIGEDADLKSIEIRGAASPVQREKVYPGNEERFDVIEY